MLEEALAIPIWFLDDYDITFSSHFYKRVMHLPMAQDCRVMSSVCVHATPVEVVAHIDKEVGLCVWCSLLDGIGNLDLRPSQDSCRFDCVKHILLPQPACAL